MATKYKIPVGGPSPVPDKHVATGDTIEWTNAAPIGGGSITIEFRDNSSPVGWVFAKSAPGQSLQATVCVPPDPTRTYTYHPDVPRVGGGSPESAQPAANDPSIIVDSGPRPRQPQAAKARRPTSATRSKRTNKTATRTGARKSSRKKK